MESIFRKSALILVLLVFGFITQVLASPVLFFDDGIRVFRGGAKVHGVESVSAITKVGKLNKLSSGALLGPKHSNIQDLLDLAKKENRISFANSLNYARKFQALENGDVLLLKCLKESRCNLDSFFKVASKSPIHSQVVGKYPTLTLPQANQKVGLINENIMNKYFISTGWAKIEGEIGRNGIDGLFIRKKKGDIVDVMIVESKYNKSGLQHTQNGQQMTKQWVTKKILDLQKQYSNNTDYNIIQKFVQSDSYRALLWNLRVSDQKLIIKLDKVHDKLGKVVTKKIKGRDKMKVHYSGNQQVNLESPENKFQSKVVKWYQEELNNI